jgi:hypothetical protein
MQMATIDLLMVFLDVSKRKFDAQLSLTPGSRRFYTASSGSPYDARVKRLIVLQGEPKDESAGPEDGEPCHHATNHGKLYFNSRCPRSQVAMFGAHAPLSRALARDGTSFANRTSLRIKSAAHSDQLVRLHGVAGVWEHHFIGGRD